MMLGFTEVGSPKYGEILIVPDFERFAVKVIIAAEGAKVSTEIPILENVTDREYYGKTADFVVCDEKLAIRQVYMGGRSASNGA
jgi:hypothetical protein